MGLGAPRQPMELGALRQPMELGAPRQSIGLGAPRKLMGLGDSWMVLRSRLEFAQLLKSAGWFFKAL
ncbi:hypothetical protein PS1_008087 [Malus domestica]